jgi:hypothetical protein
MVLMKGVVHEIMPPDLFWHRSKINGKNKAAAPMLTKKSDA